MKKYILVFVCFIFALSVVPALAEPPEQYFGNPPTPVVEEKDTEEEKEEKHPCPFYIKTDTYHYCFSCHTQPSGKLKEINWHDLYNYPNSETSFIFDNFGNPIAGRYEIIGGVGNGFGLENSIEYFRKHLPIGSKIIVELHTHGGSMYGMWRMASMLREIQPEYQIETRLYGAAISAGFILFLSGEERLMGKHSLLMWHELQMVSWIKRESTSTAMDEAMWMKQMQANAHNFIEEITEGKITHEMLQTKIKNDREWWITGPEAMELGLATGMLD